MKKPTNGYYVLIKQHSDDAIVKVSGPHHSMRTAEKIERGMNINLAPRVFELLIQSECLVELPAHHCSPYCSCV